MSLAAYRKLVATIGKKHEMVPTEEIVESLRAVKDEGEREHIVQAVGTVVQCLECRVTCALNFPNKVILGPPGETRRISPGNLATRGMIPPFASGSGSFIEFQFLRARRLIYAE